MASPTSESKTSDRTVTIVLPTATEPPTFSSSTTNTSFTTEPVTFPDNTTSVTPEGSTDDSDDNKAAIIGAAVAAFVVTCILVFLIFLLIYRRRKRRKKSPPPMLPHPNGTPYMTYHSGNEHVFENVASEVEGEDSTPEYRTATEPENDVNAALQAEADVVTEEDMSPLYVMPLPTTVTEGDLDHEYMTASSLEATSSWGAAAAPLPADPSPATSGIDPNRMDSQKYLIPVPSPKTSRSSDSTQPHSGFIPTHHSEPDLSANLRKAQGPHFKWMPSPLIVHKPEPDTTESENTYYSMNVNQPSCRISVTPRSPVDPEAPPTPVFGTKARDYVNVGKKTEPKSPADSPHVLSNGAQGLQEEDEASKGLYMNVAEVERKVKDMTASDMKQTATEVSAPASSASKPPVKAKPPKPLPKPMKPGKTGPNPSPVLSKSASVQEKEDENEKEEEEEEEEGEEHEYEVLATAAHGLYLNVSAIHDAESRETSTGVDSNKTKDATAMKKPDLKKATLPQSVTQHPKEPLLIKEKHPAFSRDVQKDDVASERHDNEANASSDVDGHDDYHDDGELSSAVYANVPRRKDDGRLKDAFRKTSAPCGPVTNVKNQRVKTASTGEVNKVGAVDISELKRALKSHVKK